MTPGTMTHHRILCRLGTALGIARSSCRRLRRGRGASLQAALLATGLLLSACTYDGGIDNPAIRRVQWFSYAQGDDIAADCVAGAPDRYRLLYNADFLEQVRSYEVTGDGSGGAVLITRAAPGGASLFDVHLEDLHGSWSWYKSESTLDAEAFSALVALLESDGLWQHREGLIRLNSRDFYWLVTACVDGRFETGAWRHGPDDITQLAFARRLFALDETALPVAGPRPVAAGDRYGRSGHAGEDLTIRPFWLTVDDRGTGG